MTSRAPVSPLSRAALAARGSAATPAQVRIVHLGLGAFHRSHQVWYTERATDGAQWGIAAFTGRRPGLAPALASQDGLFTLIERSDDGDRAQIIRSLVEAHDGSEQRRMSGFIADAKTAMVTLTVTEAGYRLTQDGSPDLGDPEVADDLVRLRAAFAERRLPDPELIAPSTVLGRLVLGLEARRRAHGAPVAVIPCDNLSENGRLVAMGVGRFAAMVSASTARWIEGTVSFVSTSVDRVTPATREADLAEAIELTGFRDAAPVVAEPFADWIMCGEFPAGRPEWESAGARFVDDIGPFERRKLWLLNGAHSLLAYAGALRGLETVSEAIADPACRNWMETYWDESCRALSEERADLDLAEYRRTLIHRFGNKRIGHSLQQIGADGVTKLRTRVVETAIHERRAGRTAQGVARVLGSWAALVLNAAALPDSQADAVAAAAARTGVEPVESLVRLIDPRLAADSAFVDEVRSVTAGAFGAFGGRGGRGEHRDSR